jgi:NTP pyrophosphatase (non-canonical NTP hydrolase)
LSQLTCIVEEVGEISRILNHEHGEKPKKSGEMHDKLEDAIADVMYSLLCLANTFDINMDELLKKTIAKLETRDKDRFKKQ